MLKFVVLCPLIKLSFPTPFIANKTPKYWIINSRPNRATKHVPQKMPSPRLNGLIIDTKGGEIIRTQAQNGEVKMSIIIIAVNIQSLFQAGFQKNWCAIEKF